MPLDASLTDPVQYLLESLPMVVEACPPRLFRLCACACGCEIGQVTHFYVCFRWCGVAGSLPLCCQLSGRLSVYSPTRSESAVPPASRLPAIVELGIVLCLGASRRCRGQARCRCRSQAVCLLAPC